LTDEMLVTIINNVLFGIFLSILLYR